MLSDRNGVSFWENGYVRSLGPVVRTVYAYLMGSCDNPAGVVTASVRKISIGAGVPGKSVESALEVLSSDEKLSVCGENRIVLVDFLEYAPSCGTIAQTFVRILREVDRISDKQVRDRVLVLFASRGIDLPVAGKTQAKEVRRVYVRRPSSNTGGENVPAVSGSDAGKTERRHAFSVSEEEVDRYIVVYDEMFGDVSPRDVTPGERKGVVRGRRMLVKNRIAEMGASWEIRHREVLRRARDSKFLSGNKTTFRMTFGWLIAKRENAQRIMEGQYDGSSHGAGRTGALGELRKFAEDQGVRDPWTGPKAGSGNG